MKKWIVVLSALSFLLVPACGAEECAEEPTATVAITTVADTAITTMAAGTTIVMPADTEQTTRLPRPMPSWQEAYTDYILHCYEPFGAFVTAGLADLDKNGVPELILISDTQGTLGGSVDFVTYSRSSHKAEYLLRASINSDFAIAKNGRDIYFYETFHRLNHNGYGFLSVMKNAGGEITCIPLLRAGIVDCDVETKENKLYWDVFGEELLLTNKALLKYLFIEGYVDGAWSGIAPEEYLRRKQSCIGKEECGQPVTDLPKLRRNLYSLGSMEHSDEYYDWNDRQPDKKELSAFFAIWTGTLTPVPGQNQS